MPEAIQAQEKALFTPGPWAWGNALEEVDPREKKPSELVAYAPPDSEGRQHITTVLDLALQHEMRPADALLIAAAPDMHRALKVQRQIITESEMQCRDQGDSGDLCDGTDCIYCALLISIDEPLAKAEGRNA